VYAEGLQMSRELALPLALPFVFVVALLAALLVLLPIPLAGRIPILGAMLLEAAVAAFLLVGLSRIRIAIDDRAVTVSFRTLSTKRIPLARIASCIPTEARVWGMSHRYRRSRYPGDAGARRAVLLSLTNGAQIMFTSRHPDAACAALRHHAPNIAFTAS
jgi:hypothetical protein